MAACTSRLRRPRTLALLIVTVVVLGGGSVSYADREPFGRRASEHAEVGKILGKASARAQARRAAATPAPLPTTTVAAPTTTATDPGKSVGDAAVKPTTTVATPTTTAGRAPAKATVAAPTTTAAPAPSTTAAAPAGTAAPAGALKVTDFGAVPDDGVDDQAALQRAFDAAPAGGAVVIPPGTYHHSNVLYVSNVGVGVWGYGAILDGTNPNAHAVVLRADGTALRGVTLVNHPTVRKTAEEHSGVSLHLTKGNVVRDVTVRGASAVGILVWGARDFEIVGNTVVDTMADGIHNVGGATNGVVRNNTLRNVGDDCFAVISYVVERVITSNITIRDNTCTGGKARGVAVVGGEDVLIQNNIITASAAAGIYLASEPGYDTYAAKRVRVIGNRLIGVDTSSALRHGAIFIWGRAGGTTTAELGPRTFQNEDLTIQGNRIENTVNGAAHIVAQGSYSSRVNVLENSGAGGLRMLYVEMPAGAYNSVANVNDAVPVGDHVGDASILP